MSVSTVEVTGAQTHTVEVVDARPAFTVEIGADLAVSVVEVDGVAITPPPASVVEVSAPADMAVEVSTTTVSTEVVEIGAVGPRGEPGPPGPAGQGYVHRQAAPAATWTIPHGLGGKPSMVIVLDSDPALPVYTDVTYPDLNTATVSLPTPESGWAYL